MVYVISSSTFTVLPVTGFADLLYFRSDLFTTVVTSFVGSSGLSGLSGFLFIVAVLAICFVNASPSNSFTVTSKLTVVSPGVFSSVLAGTVTLIPSLKSVSVFVSSSTPFTLILPATKLVPSGILSFTTTSPAKSPLFCTLIV